MIFQNRSALGLSFDYMPMTVYYTEESITTLTLQFFRMILTGSRSGKTSGLWSSTQRNALPLVSLIRLNPSTQPTPSMDTAWNLQLTTHQSQNVNRLPVKPQLIKLTTGSFCRDTDVILFGWFLRCRRTLVVNHRIQSKDRRRRRRRRR